MLGIFRNGRGQFGLSSREQRGFFVLFCFLPSIYQGDESDES